MLLSVRTETAFKELFRVALVLKQSGRYDPLFCCSAQGYSLSRMRSACAANDIPLISVSGKPLSPQAGVLSYAVVKNWALKILPFWLIEIVNTIKYFGIQVASLGNHKNLLGKVKPAVVVVPEDGLGGDLVLIKLAQKRGIPVVVVPYEFSTKKQIVEALQSNQDYQKKYGMNNVFNRIAARLFPSWVYTYEGEKMLREPLSAILVLEILQLAPGNPWTVHGGSADYLAVESEMMHHHYLAEGLPEKKLVLTGALSSDHLFDALSRKETLKNELYRSLGLKNGHKLLLSAVPTDYTGRAECEFGNYGEFIDFWIGSLKQLKDVNIVLQLHPAVTPEQEAYIREQGIPVSSENIANLIPLCDLLVTSVSSIIRMAIACRIPVVNYDVYRFRYADYADEQGVLTIWDKDEFRGALSSLLYDQSYYRTIVDYQTRSSDAWGVLDGQVEYHLLDFFDGLCERKDKGI